MKYILKTTLLGILITILSCSAKAQDQTQDSILTLITDHLNEDSVRAKLLLDYAKSWFPAEIDSVVKYNNLGLELSERLQFKTGMMRGLNGKALKLWMEDRYTEAIIPYQKALGYAREINDLNYLVTISNNIGVLYGNQGLLDSAKHYQILSLEYAKELGNPEKIAKTLSDLSSIAGYQGDFVEAIQNLLEARRICEENQLLSELTTTYLRLGIQYSYIRDFNKSREAYFKTEELNDSLKSQRIQLSLLNNLGYLYYDVKKDYDSARMFMFQAKSLAEEQNNSSSVLTINLNIGNTFMEEKNYPEALKYYLLVYQSPLIDNFTIEKTALFVNLGTIYFRMGNHRKAESFSLKGLEMARMNHILRFEMNACETMANIQEKRGNCMAATYYYQQANMLRDSLYSEQLTDRIAEAEFSHRLEIKDAENRLLQKENEIKQEVITRQWMLVAGITTTLLLIIILLFVILRSRNRQKALNKQLDIQNIQLKEVNQTKDKFFSIIAHDLKSPFNGLLGLLNELDQSYEEIDEETRRRIIHNLRKSAQNTYGLILNLLEWTQTQRETLTTHPEKIVLHELVDDVFETMMTRADMKSHTLLNQTDPQVHLMADAQMLRSLFQNLINNAIKFTPKGGTITVSSEINEDTLEICVSDTGIGIPENEIQNLFKIDKSFKRNGTDKEAGTGLGLILCKEYIEILNGTISVASIEGEGSKFCMILPKN